MGESIDQVDLVSFDNCCLMIAWRNQRKDAGIRLEPFECGGAYKIKVIAATVLGSQGLRVCPRIKSPLHNVEEIAHDYDGSVLFERIVQVLFEEGTVAVR